MVGFDDDLLAIKERLLEDSSGLQIIPIVGMGGIGKTTLAKTVYEDSLTTQHFDIRVWIVVSQEYRLKEILLGILRSMENLTDELSQENDTKLAQKVYQNLIGRRYLVVLDDIWSTNSWDDLKRLFPDDGSQSRILMTTRLSNVAVYAESSSSLHEMHFLNEDQSWSLLREKVFAQETCPIHLEEIGKTIAKSCHGLPLTIVVVAGLLLKDKTVEYWADISTNISLAEPTIAEQCSKILSLSYDRLPICLKPCFLYMTAFPEDYEIQISRLVKLWIAEGFVRPNESKTLEDEGEEYLEDLVLRNLILVRKKRSNGALKTVVIHDLLREICVTKAEEEGFFHHVTPRNSQQGIENNRRRYSIHSRISQKCLENILGSTTSSLIFFPANGGQMLTYTLDIRHVEIFDALDVNFNVFPVQITEAVSLRYLAFTYDYKQECEFPSSISNLRNLHTLIVNQRSSFASNSLYLPISILQMPKLRHLILFNFSYIQIPHGFVPTVQETNLHTLFHVTNLKFSEEVIHLLRNLKKLGLNYLFLSNQDCESYYLSNLVRLQNLEELNLVVKLEKPDELPSFSPANIAFPDSLKILTLKDCRIAWADMTIVGSLPNLEVLKLIDRAFIGEQWYPIEGEFLRLKYLRFNAGNLEYWGAESMHFPRLET